MVATIRERVYAEAPAPQNLPESLVMPNWTEIAPKEIFDDSEVETILASAPDVEYALELLGFDDGLTYWEYNLLTSWAGKQLLFLDYDGLDD